MRLLRWPVSIHVHFGLPAFLRKFKECPFKPQVCNSVRVRQIVDHRGEEPATLVTVLEFNDEDTNLDDPEHVDLIQLQSSLNASGTFFIWTCSCGAPGCAGRFEGVQVSHADGVTFWHDLDTKRKYIIRSVELRRAFDHGIMDGRLLISSSVGLEATPESNFDLFRNEG